MPSFQLASNNQSFQLSCGPMHCSGGGCRHCSRARRSRVKKMAGFDKIFDSILVGAYVLSAGLIVYSLLLFNLVAAENTQAAAAQTLNNRLQIPVISYLPNPKQVWYDTIFFMDKAGGDMGDPLAATIELYSNGLGKAFAGFGQALSIVPNALTSPPAFARSGT